MDVTETGMNVRMTIETKKLHLRHLQCRKPYSLLLLLKKTNKTTNITNCATDKKIMQRLSTNQKKKMTMAARGQNQPPLHIEAFTNALSMTF